jgi:hypothetical protein
MRSETVEGDAIDAEPVDETSEKRLAKLEEFRQTWGANPNKKDAMNLLALASECESAAVYSDAVHDVVREWRAGRIEGLSGADLADLIETHLWLLPAQEKMSGNGFVIKQEISKLRA